MIEHDYIKIFTKLKVQNHLKNVLPKHWKT